MNNRDRFFATIHHQPVDHPASWLGLPVPLAEQALIKYFGVSGIDQLRILIIGLVTLVTSFCITSYGSYIGEEIINNGH